MSQSLLQTFSLIKSDMQRRCDYENKPLTWLRVVRFCFYYSTISAIIYRFQVFFFCHRLKPIACFLSIINNLIFTVKIDSDTNIGPGFVMLHANFINIGPKVTIGKNCILGHQNTIYASPFCDEKTVISSAAHYNQAPKIGDGLKMGGGAVIFGDVTIGNRVKVSMNSAVDKSFPDDSVLFGVPAKNVANPPLEK